METLVSVTHKSTTDRKVVTCSSDLRNRGVPKYQNDPHTKSQLTAREQYSGNDHVAHNFTCVSLHFAHPFTTPTAFSSPSLGSPSSLQLSFQTCTRVHTEEEMCAFLRSLPHSYPLWFRTPLTPFLPPHNPLPLSHYKISYPAYFSLKFYGTPSFY